MIRYDKVQSSWSSRVFYVRVNQVRYGTNKYNTGTIRYGEEKFIEAASANHKQQFYVILTQKGVKDDNYQSNVFDPFSRAVYVTFEGFEEKNKNIRLTKA